jgi:hypothetical protein
MKRRAFLLSPSLALLAQSPPRRQISGVYPHLAMFNSQHECGTGAVVPWAGRLWVVTYSPHQPVGSDDRLYEIDEQLNQTIRPESIGGTPANRMIHRESKQLFIGPYAIDAQRRVRPIPYSSMHGRPTGNARHLTDPARKLYYASMEEGFYEVDVQTLAVRQLYEDGNALLARKAASDVAGPLLPGYHGKGFYSGQGRVVYSNNGEIGGGNLPPDTPSGCLAEWDGKDWHVIRRNQFTDVTGPGGIEGNPNPASDPIWAIGWDHRSVILMLLDKGVWHSYRLPKATHTYDGAHGWNTEWPRIRDIGETELLMTMHGMFWRFPKTFRANRSAGIAPRSTYIRVVGDFARWNNRLVLGCDDTAKNEFFNTRRVKGKIPGPGRSQSNLWFLYPSKLDTFGPPIGRGAVWINDDLPANQPSEPYLFSGFAKRLLHLTHQTDSPVTFSLEVDRAGSGDWTPLRQITVPARGYVHYTFLPSETGVWIRLAPLRPCLQATAFFQYAALDTRGAARSAPPPTAPGALLWTRDGNTGTLLLATSKTLYEVDANLAARPLADAKLHSWMKDNLPAPAAALEADAASVIYVDEAGKRWRLPKGPAPPAGSRIAREVSTERDLFHSHGTFYELPSNNAGGIAMVRPVCTHNLPIQDFCSWRGLTVLAGLPRVELPAGEFVTTTDGQHRLWLGASDDLWRFGKPKGEGGPWHETEVQANAPSDPYLLTGYDQKQLRLSHNGKAKVDIRIEIDLTGSGLWVPYQTFAVAPGQPTLHSFPAGYNAYWLRAVALAETVATVTLIYS